MHSHKLMILLGAAAILLAVPACSTASPDTSTAPIITNTPFAPAIIDTAASAPAAADPTAPAAANTATAVPATVPSTVPSLPVINAPSIQSLYMLDANNGWAVTDSGVARTTDGGATWYNATPNGLNGVPASPFFLNTTTGWLAVGGSDPTSGTLYHTSDGGATWTSTAVPFGGGTIMFVDPMNGWELVGLSAGMSQQAVAIFRTSDGGTTWSRVFINDPSVSGYSSSLPLTGDKNGIVAMDTTHAWVTGAQPSSDFVYLYTTQDGGANWAHQDISIPAAYKGAMTGADLPVFFNANEAVLPVLLFADANGSEFYVSHDGGQSWSATTPVAQSGFLAVGSPSDFFVWDGAAPLSASHDAGVSWSSITPNVNIKDNMAAMQFVNAATGWALTSDANNHRMLYKTIDGGINWTVQIP